MGVESREFLDTAERLIGNDEEADLRSAISRAYYAVFHKVKDVGSRRMDWKDGPGDHRRARNFVDGYRDRQQERRFRRLQTQRKRADYKLNVNVSYRQAKDQIEKAEAFFEAE